MDDKKKSLLLSLKEKANENRETIVGVSAIVVPIVIGVYAGKRSAKKTVNRERANLRKEMINGNIVVPLDGKEYITFPVMYEEYRKD